MRRLQPLKTAKVYLSLLLLGCSASKHVPSEAEHAYAKVRQASTSEAGNKERLRFLAKESAVLLRQHPDERWLYQRGMESIYSLAYAEGAFDAAELYAQGRELGRACLRVNGAWLVMEDLSGGRITASGLRRLEPRDLPCLRGLLQHWIRWVEAHGAAATIDLRPLRLLAARGMELAQPQTDWVDHWAMAMILSLGPPSEEEFENAEFHFERAMALSPGLATSAVDRLAGHIRQGKASAALQRELRNLGRGQYSVNESSPWALQNQRALKRAIELLAQLREEIDD